MPDNNNNQPQYIYVQQPGYNFQDDEVEINLLELFGSVWKRKWFIVLAGFLAGVLGLGYAFILPFTYKAECRILPKTAGGGGGGGLAALASQFGGLAGMMGINVPTKSTPSGMLLGVIGSDSIADRIIDRFNIMEEQDEDTLRSAVRKSVLSPLETDEDKDSGIITISYVADDPQKAADIANAFVEEAQKKMMELSIESAQQSRQFYETQLLQAQQELTEAEEAMMKYQQSSGIIVLEQQAKALIDAISSVRTQIAAKNVEISTLKTYTRPDNPTLKLAQSELEGLQSELRRLEEEQRKSDAGRTPGRNLGNIMPSIEEIPELGVEYERYMRALKIAGAKYQLMFQQYESAKLDEIMDIPTISIVDPAVAPDHKYKPKRAQIALIWAFVGGFLASCKAAYPNFKKQISANKRKNDDEDYDEED